LISVKPFYLGIFYQCNCLLSVTQQFAQCQDPGATSVLLNKKDQGTVL